MDTISYVDYVSAAQTPVISMIDSLDGEIIQLARAPLPVLIAIFNGGKYSLLMRGGNTNSVMCKDLSCRFQSKSCCHCAAYEGLQLYNILSVSHP